MRSLARLADGAPGQVGVEPLRLLGPGVGVALVRLLLGRMSLERPPRSNAIAEDAPSYFLKVHIA